MTKRLPHFTLPVPAASGHDRTSTVQADPDRLLPLFDRLVDETLAQVEACPAKTDATFAGYEGLLAAIRSATTLEGTLLEKGITYLIDANPDLVSVQLDRPLPVHEVAKAVFRKNEWSKASGLRLDAAVVTREFYKPDLLLVDRSNNLALLLDVKRSAASYKFRTLNDLRSRMMAAALVVRDVLEREHDAPPVERADIAIIDASGECRDERRGIFALPDLDWMFGIDGAAAMILRLRSMYGSRIRALLDERCRAIAGTRLPECRPVDSSTGRRTRVREGLDANDDRLSDQSPAGGIDDAAGAASDDCHPDSGFGPDDEQADDLYRRRAGPSRPRPFVPVATLPRVAVGIARRMH